MQYLQWISLSQASFLFFLPCTHIGICVHHINLSAYQLVTTVGVTVDLSNNAGHSFLSYSVLRSIVFSYIASTCTFLVKCNKTWFGLIRLSLFSTASFISYHAPHCLLVISMSLLCCYSVSSTQHIFSDWLCFPLFSLEQCPTRNKYWPWTFPSLVGKECGARGLQGACEIRIHQLAGIEGDPSGSQAFLTDSETTSWPCVVVRVSYINHQGSTRLDGHSGWSMAHPHWEIMYQGSVDTQKSGICTKINAPDLGKVWQVQLDLFQVSTLPIIVLPDGAGKPAATEYRDRITIYNMYFLLWFFPHCAEFRN